MKTAENLVITFKCPDRNKTRDIQKRIKILSAILEQTHYEIVEKALSLLEKEDIY